MAGIGLLVPGGSSAFPFRPERVLSIPPRADVLQHNGCRRRDEFGDIPSPSGNHNLLGEIHKFGGQPEGNPFSLIGGSNDKPIRLVPFKFGRQDKRFGMAAFPKLGPGCGRFRKALHFVKPIIIIPGPPTFDIDGKPRSIRQFATLSFGPFEDFNDLLNKWLIGPSLVLDVDTFRVFLGGQPFIQSGLACFFWPPDLFLPELQ